MVIFNEIFYFNFFLGLKPLISFSLAFNGVVLTLWSRLIVVSWTFIVLYFFLPLKHIFQLCSSILSVFLYLKADPMTFVTVFPNPEGVVNLFSLLWFLDLLGVFEASSKGVFKEATERVLTRDISGELDPMPGQVVVISRLVTEVLLLGRERLPRLLFLPGVGGPGLL